ncbi:MAG: hypothetical protein IJX81_04325, partial [Clostridia bacterium]|nr:hypothetical protein [Clostridia bacterium]
MSMKKRFAVALLSVLTIVFGTIGFASCDKECLHKWGEWTTTEATCTDDGVRTRICTLCQESETETIATALGHAYGEWTSNGDGTHTKTCANDETHTVTEDCTGGSSTCTEKGVCEVCNAEYVDSIGHDYGAWVANNDGTHTKTCKNDATHKVTENCAGGTATCTEKAVCSTCNVAYGSVLAHTYDQEVATADYKATDATCEAKATYYYSCECGAKGTETFENGAALGHAYGAWVTNNDGTHTKTCGNDATHKVTENCAGGEATCEEKAVCTGCNTAYGDVLGHAYGAWVSNGDGTHTKVCKNDATHKVTDDCAGGTAT